MPRTALKRFFEGVVVALLPLTAAACHDDARSDAMDLSVPADLTAMSEPAPDLSEVVFTPTPDTCEIDHPPVFVPLPPHFDTDGGVGNCVAGTICPQSGCPSDYEICCEFQADGGMELMCSYYCATGRRP